MAILARNLSLLLAALMLASGWASAADRGQSIGSSNALQLYKNCVLRSLMTACTDLIEQAKTPGFSNVYSVAAAYYKRGTLNVNGTLKLTQLSADRHFETDPPCLAV